MRSNRIKTEHLRSLILLIVVVTIGGGAVLIQNLYAKRSSVLRVFVSVDGKTVISVPLDEDRELFVTDGIVTDSPGSGAVISDQDDMKKRETDETVKTCETNRIVIENGTVRVSEANCKNGICVKTGEIRMSGERILCLPHRLIVSIEGGEVDGIAQ